MNFSFSFPIMNSGLQLLMKTNSKSKDDSEIWSIFWGLEWEIWLLVGFTPLIISIYILFN